VCSRSVGDKRIGPGATDPLRILKEERMKKELFIGGLIVLIVFLVGANIAKAEKPPKGEEADPIWKTTVA
jgi:hypothetical protein